MKTFISNTFSNVSERISKHIENSKMIKLGLLASGLILGYSLGLPLPILTAAPFILAPKLLPTLITSRS